MPSGIYKHKSGNSASGWQGGKIRKICPMCGKEFEVHPYDDKRAKYCGLQCRYKSQRGRKLSEETKKKLSEALSGKKAPNWKGGIFYDKNSYIMVYCLNHPRPNGTFPNHMKRAVLVLEKKIGRYLKIGEIPHHINSIKDDDRPENLMLFSSNSEHMKYHWKYCNLRSIIKNIKNRKLKAEEDFENQ